jgi:predicted GTPase
MERERVLILGAAGRDFHDFNVSFRDDPRYEVVGFTAAQIPYIACRTYPGELGGRLYPGGLPIWPEEALERVIKDRMVDRCILAYSDLSHLEVMSLASRVLAAGADFGLMGRSTMLESSRPSIAVCAVRTGAGKSQVARYAAEQLRSLGQRTVVVRHPMPYGNLIEEAVQRFSSYEDLAKAATIEEREEYEAHIKKGTVVYAGVDYRAVLRQAEGEADVLIWDGGNNDLPFLRPDLWITVADALRPGHELAYHPGEANFRSADVIVINKANAASDEAVGIIRANAERVNPRASVIVTASKLTVEDPGAIRGRRVLVIEDGPTITHGGMPHGAGFAAAKLCGAAELVDPRPFVSGSLRDVFARYGHIGRVLPAVGYSPEQVRELEDAVNRADCESVIIATPVDLRRLIRMMKPSTAVFYELADMGEPLLRDRIAEFASGIAMRR